MSNFPPTVAEAEIISHLVIGNANQIAVAEDTLSKDLEALRISEANLEHLEEALANSVRIFNMHKRHVETLSYDMNALEQLGNAIGERGAVLTHESENLWLRVGHNPPALFAKMIEESLKNLRQYLEHATQVYSVTEQQAVRLVEERDRERVLVATKRDVVPVQHKHASLMRRFAAQFRLPAEVLLHIFEWSIRGTIEDYLEDPGKQRMVYMPLLLAQVCKSWRAIMVETPSVWTTIDIPCSLARIRPNLARLRELIGRCRQNPVKLVLNLGDISIPAGVQPDLKCWIPEIEGPVPDIHLHIIVPLVCGPPGAEPAYVRLQYGERPANSITYQGRFGRLFTSQQPTRVVLPPASSLRFLKLDSSPLRFTSEYLSEWDAEFGPRYSFESFLPILRRSQDHLKRMMIRLPFKSRLPEETTFTLPNLVSLGLVLHSNLDLHRLAAPRIEEIYLYEPRVDDGFRGVLGWNRYPSCSIVTMNIVDWGQQMRRTIGEYEGLLAALLMSAPRLEVLRLVNCEVDIMVLARVLQGRPIAHLILQ
ncbi:hypothetical protein FRC17_007855 [Serendipita sp. 399]|nr:hypothetical protein FRC17_007855 [Serendipita sp. 399]